MNKELQNDFPLLFQTAEHLMNNAFFFRHSIPKILDSNFNFELGERICNTAMKIAENDWEKYSKNSEGVIYLSMMFLKLQPGLEKTGKYLYSSFKEVEENAYSESGGPDYLWGLYFSQIFWKIHHNFTKFFLDEFVKGNKNNGTVIEIPSGTGFFLSEFIRGNPTWHGTGIDLAESSIEFTKTIFRANEIPNKSYEIIKLNLFDVPEEKQFDRIMCGEFLEHLEDPHAALKKFNRLLKLDGKVFITVAVWAAMIDHIYLYESAEHVRKEIQEAGFSIEKELVQAVFEKDEGDPEKSKIPVSYGAILSKKH